MASKSQRGNSEPTVPNEQAAAPETQLAPGPDQELGEFVSGLPDEQKIKLFGLLKHRRVETTFSGPLPPPDHFRKYNEVLSSAADRILGMAEREQTIRADGQAEILANDRRKINGATTMGLAMIAVAGLATWLDNWPVALPLGLAGTVLALVRRVMEFLRYWMDRQDRRRERDAPRN